MTNIPPIPNKEEYDKYVFEAANLAIQRELTDKQKEYFKALVEEIKRYEKENNLEQ